MKIYTVEGHKGPFKRFSELASAMGWNYQNARYNVNTYGKYKGLKVEYIEELCIGLRELIEGNSWQENDFNPEKEGNQDVTFGIGLTGYYTVVVAVKNTVNMVEVATYARGEKLLVDDGDVEFTEIISVHDYFGDEFDIDKTTAKMLLYYLEV